MSMEFTDNQSMGGGNLASGIALGSIMNRRDDRTDYIWAVIIFAIIFIIALVFLAAFMRRDDHRKDYGGTDIAAALTPLIAAKSMDCNNGYKNSEIDKLEIMQKLEASEDRARQTQTQQEIGALGKEFANIGFGLSGQIHCTDKTNLENFAKLENQMGMMQMGMGQLLQKANNEDIIQGVINRLCCSPCMGRP